MPTPEDRIPAPLSPYGASKWAAESYVKHVVAVVGHPARGVPARQRVRSRARARTARRASSRSSPTTCMTGRAPKLYGHGRPTRDYVYVADVVSALLAASGKAGTYNIATGVETDVMSDLERAEQDAPASEIEPELADLRPGELQHSCLDVSLAERELGWRPQVPIGEGLALTYRALIEEFEQA